MATKAKKSARRKSGRPGKAGSSARRRKTMKKSSAKKSSAKRGSARRSAAKRSRPAAKKSRRQSAVGRVKRVTREVAQQATAAVTAGVETLRDLGENFVERVRQD